MTADPIRIPVAHDYPPQSYVEVTPDLAAEILIKAIERRPDLARRIVALAQADVPSVVGCTVNLISSRICQRGQKGCVIDHDAPPVALDQEWRDPNGPMPQTAPTVADDDAAEGRHVWDDTGERCVKCGDKDWMGGPCVPKQTVANKIIQDTYAAVDEPWEYDIIENMYQLMRSVGAVYGDRPQTCRNGLAAILAAIKAGKVPGICTTAERDKALADLATANGDAVGYRQNIRILTADLAAMTERAEKAEDDAKHYKEYVDHNYKACEKAKADIAALTAERDRLKVDASNHAADAAQVRRERDAATARVVELERDRAVIDAYHDGKPIECRLKGTDRWYPCNDPAWYFSTHDYRLAKPEAGKGDAP